MSSCSVCGSKNASGGADFGRSNSSSSDVARADTSEPACLLLGLPDHLALDIIAYLDRIALCSVSRTCRRMSKMAGMWTELLMRL